MIFLYQISIQIYWLSIKIASLFNNKAKLWIDGRKNTFEKIKKELNPNENIYWFHCASLGEYEQGKPLMEQLKNNDKSLKVLVTFFSPSGYEYRKDEKLIDYCYYLPIDTPKNAKLFIEITKPKKAFFVKYEFWYFYLRELHSIKIPTFLISGAFRKEQPFFKWYGTIHKEMLNYFNHFFLQNQKSFELLSSLGHQNITITGDTRIDRVYKNSLSPKKLDLIKRFKAEKKVIVAGSSWQQEEKILCDFISSSDKEFKYIIAPHNINKSHILEIEKLLSETSTNYIKYSEATEENITQNTILIIDNIGILADAYQYTDIAFVGGGFKNSLHNVLEPASYGNVVMFGKKHSKFHEAEDLINENAAYEISYTDDLIAAINHLLTDDRLITAKNAAKNYIKKGVGATDKILKQLEI